MARVCRTASTVFGLLRDEPGAEREERDARRGVEGAADPPAGEHHPGPVQTGDQEQQAEQRQDGVSQRGAAIAATPGCGPRNCAAIAHRCPPAGPEVSGR